MLHGAISKGKPTRHYGKWRIRWIDENGVRHSRVFDTKETATLELQREELAVEERRRGLRPAAGERRTFADAADYWERHAPAKRSEKDDLSILKQLRPHLGRLDLRDTEAWVLAIDRYKGLKTQLSDKTLANHLTLLGSILRAALDLGWLERLPKIKKPRFDIASESYRYLKSDDEIRRFLDAAAAQGPMVHALYATAVYTGMRAGELAGLRWEDVDLASRRIMVRRSFDGPTKNGKSRPVPILSVLLPVLSEWRLRHPGELVFTNRGGRMLQPSARVFQEVLHRVLDRAGFPKEERNGTTKRHVHFHDLRHTFASTWVAKSGDLYKLQAILGRESSVRRRCSNTS